MKKILYILFTMMLLITPAYSAEEESEEGSPQQEMTKLVQCMATNTELMHLHNQIAASMIALSSPKHQTMTPLIKSYLDMAKIEKNKTRNFSDIAEQLYIPKFMAHGQSKDEIDEVTAKLLGKVLSDISQNINDPANGIPEKIAIEQVLQNQAYTCDTHFAKIMDMNTY